MLLRRAAESVARQTFTDYVWVVVNDGGDAGPVEETVMRSGVPAHQIVLCSNEASVGMEAASNIGIGETESEFVVIHDDDDSWHPDFLKRTVSFLDGSVGLKYGGVITHSMYVSEEIDGDRVIEWGRWPYQDWVQHIQLSELIVENFFPPIAFVFRRAVCEAIGCFDENLPVLGDWDFAIRFLLKTDIGVITEQLAFYHHRDRGVANAYSNSVVGGIAKHIEYNAIVRNKFIRGASANPDWSVIASLMAQGYKHRDLRTRLQQHAHEARAALHPAPVGSADGEHVYRGDSRWCIVQAARGYYRGFAGLFRRLLPFPGDDVLERRVRTARLHPPPDFDDDAYLSRYPDVAAAVRAGTFASGFEHYFKYGRREGRLRPILK